MLENDVSLKDDETNLDQIEDNQPLEITLDMDNSALSEEDELAQATLKEEEEAAPQWVKDLRKKSDGDNRKIRELEQQIKDKDKDEEKSAPVLGKEPDMSDDGIDYDEVIFKLKWREWNAAAETVKAVDAQNKAKEVQVTKVFTDRLAKYHENKVKLNVPDYAKSETAVLATLDTTQQGIIINYFDNPEKLVAALGGNDKALLGLASNKDPITFALAVKDLQGKMKVTTRQAPAPESRVSGNGTIAPATSKKLNELHVNAQKTGDYTQYYAYKSELKTK